MVSMELYVKELAHLPEVPYRIFISNVNSYYAYTIIECLRTDNLTDENPNIIVGTMNPKENNPKPKGITRIIDNKKLKQLSQIILDSNVIIYDLSTSDLDEVEHAIKILKLGEHSEEKVLILITSVMTWSATPKKDKDTVEYYTDKEFTLRRGLPKYEQYKNLENLALDAGKNNHNVHSYILCTGLLYGNGEDCLFRFFKQAWLLDPPELPYYDNGSNNIPLLHVRDLAEFVRKIIQKKPDHQYIIAVDYSYTTTQASIIKAISENLGIGATKSIPVSEGVWDNDFDIFNLNIKLKPTTIFEKRKNFEPFHNPDHPKFLENSIEDPNSSRIRDHSVHKIANINESHDQLEQQIINEMENPEKRQDTGKHDQSSLSINQRKAHTDKNPLNHSVDHDALSDQLEEDDDSIPFEWTCRDGFIKNFKKIAQEFMHFRGLRSNKIFITGPPLSGKSVFAKRLASQYNLPHLLISELIQEAKNFKDELGEEIRKTLHEIHEKMIEERKAEIDLERKKKKGRKDWVEPELNPDLLIPRLPEHLVTRIYQRRLAISDCFYRGYVLDGYPKSFTNAQALFIMDEKVPLTEPNEEHAKDLTSIQDQKYRIEKHLNIDLYPQTLIKLKANDEALRDRAKKLPEAVVTGSHYTDDGMIRRLLTYRKTNFNEGSAAHTHVLDFFTQNNSEPYTINFEAEPHSTMNQEDVYSGIVKFVERNGKFKTYVNKENQRKEQILKKEREEKERREREQIEKMEKKRLEEEAMLKKEIEDQEIRRIENLRKQEKEILDNRSQPLRQYLADLVVPYLTEGLIKICKDMPPNPIDQLTEFLNQKANDPEYIEILGSLKT